MATQVYTIARQRRIPFLHLNSFSDDTALYLSFFGHKAGDCSENPSPGHDQFIWQQGSTFLCAEKAMKGAARRVGL